MIRVKALFPALVLFLPWQVPAQSRDWFVSPSGSDQGDGSRIAPFATIQHASAETVTATRKARGIAVRRFVPGPPPAAGREDCPARPDYVC